MGHVATAQRLILARIDVADREAIALPFPSKALLSRQAISRHAPTLLGGVAGTMRVWVLKRLLVSTALAASLGISHSVAFDPAAVERLKTKPVCIGCDLSGASMKNAYLPGAILTNSKLTDADLSGANLNGANFSSAQLSGSDLSGASLKYSILSGADLQGARLVDTQLTGANLEAANLERALLTRVELRGARLRGARLSGADLEGANLQFVENLEAAQLVGTKLCKTRMPDGQINNSGC
jgi:uncharacterized protein YjbI with pentapeptide repeats